MNVYVKRSDLLEVLHEIESKRNQRGFSKKVLGKFKSAIHQIKKIMMENDGLKILMENKRLSFFQKLSGKEPNEICLYERRRWF